MAIDWINGFLIPIIKLTIYGGMILVAGYFLFKGLHNAWTKQLKFIWKYKIRKKPYPEKDLKWCLDCIDKGIGWYDAKKLLLINMHPQDQVNEVMWIYDAIINEMQGLKGGLNRNVREFKRNDSKTQSTELPKF